MNHRYRRLLLLLFCVTLFCLFYWMASRSPKQTGSLLAKVEEEREPAPVYPRLADLEKAGMLDGQIRSVDDEAGAAVAEPILNLANQHLIQREDPLLKSAMQSTALRSKQIYPRVRRPCGPQIEHNQHFIDRKLWRSMKAEEMSQKRQAWSDFLQQQVPTINFADYAFQGRGIVYTAYGATLPRAMASIQILRELGCNLPIEVWYLGEELDSFQLAELKKLLVEPKDLLVEQKRFPAFSSFHIYHAYAQSRNYHIKTLVLLLTRFKEVLYLDSDNMPLRDPTFLFETEEYKQTGSIFWPDFWKFPIDNPIWQIMGQQCEDEWEQESGQIVVDKQRSWKPLLVSMFLQMDHAFYFRIILGDKDTFRFGWKVTKTPYYMVPHPVGIAGRIRQGQFCGHTMVQRDHRGEILFAHTTAMKGTNALHEGNTWESLLYLDRVKPIELEPPSPRTRSFIVAYPDAIEYTGGVSKPESEGGKGLETSPNPCLTWSLRNLTVESTAAAVENWGPLAVDSFRMITENLQTYEGGAYAWLEHSYYKFGGLGSRTDATCGNGHVGNSKCMVSSECCSPWGWCGLTLDHCGVGCMGGPCYSKRKLPEQAPPGFEYCGEGKIGYGLCKDSKLCCSRFGYCSLSKDHCKKDVCLSGPCET